MKKKLNNEKMEKNIILYQKTEIQEVSLKNSCSIFVFEVNYEFLSDSINSNCRKNTVQDMFSVEENDLLIVSVNLSLK